MLKQKGIEIARTPEGIWFSIPEEQLPMQFDVFDIRGAYVKTMSIQESRTFIQLGKYEFVMGR